MREIVRINLDKSERFFKLNLTYLIKGGGWMSARFSITTLASIITVVAFGNLMSKEEYGIYSYLLSLGGSLAFLTLSGIGPAITRSVARGLEGVIPYALRLQLRYNLFAMATIGSASIYYAVNKNFVFAASLGILAIAIPISEAFHIFENILIGRKRFDLLTKLTSISIIFSSTATILTVYLTKNITVLILCFALTTLITNMLMYFIATRKIKKEKPDIKIIEEIRRTGFHITGAGLIGVVTNYIDKILLFHIAGPASLAIYGFAIAGPDRLKGLVKNLLGISLPKISERTLGEIKKVFFTRILSSLLIGFILSFAYILIAPTLFNTLLPKYTDSIIYSQVAALGLIVIPSIIYVGNIFTGQNMLRAIYLLNAGSNSMRIVLFLILGLFWQTWGLVVASLISYYFNSAYCIVLFLIESKRLEKINGRTF